MNRATLTRQWGGGWNTSVPRTVHCRVRVTHFARTERFGHQASRLDRDDQTTRHWSLVTGHWSLVTGHSSLHENLPASTSWTKSISPRK
ncbi:MAG: hypothetical protein DCC58_02525 [Chloroflexi bacterium]|nr:MAG: hypothetical protein DCC58_02525 [Chloroflexota bacterium]